MGDIPQFQVRNLSYRLSVLLPDGTPLFATATNANPPSNRLEFRDAVLTTEEFNLDSGPRYAVEGTSSVDRATDTVVLRFPVAAVATDTASGGPFVIGG